MYAKEDKIQLGRSMIEMLGVLAIVGVLSVGAVAAFNKAMTKYRINKWIDELNTVIQSFLRYEQDWKRTAKKTGHSNVGNMAKTIGVIPDTWKLEADGKKFRNSFGDIIGLYSYSDRIYLYLQYSNDKGTHQLCWNMWFNIIIPYQETIYYVHQYGKKAGGAQLESILYYGNVYCSSGKKCIREINVSELPSICGTQIEDADALVMSIYFK